MSAFRKIFENKIIKILFSFVVLVAGAAIGFYLSNASAQNEEELITAYFEREDIYDLPPDYVPYFSTNDMFPVKEYYDSKWNRLPLKDLFENRMTLFFLVSPLCEPCDETIMLFKEKIFPDLNDDIQVVYVFDTTYISEPIPQEYINDKAVSIFMSSEYLYDMYNLQVKPSLFLVDGDLKVKYSQIGYQKYINPKLMELLKSI